MKIIFTLLIFSLPYLCKAATGRCNFTGNGNASGNWNVAANWSCNRLPQAGDLIYIPIGKTVNINVTVDFDPGAPTYIVVDGTFNFSTSDKIYLSAGSGITMTSVGCMTAIYNNNSQTLNIDGVELWQSKCNSGFTPPRCGNACISNFTYGTYPPVLSVNLTSFYLEEPDNNNVIMHWTTANEKDFSHYELEKSKEDGIWSHVSMIFPNSTGEYSFNDKKSFDKYYRLKMVDMDGSFEYSKIISATDHTGNILISSEGKLKIFTEEESADITIYNLSGVIVKKTIIEKGMNDIQLNTGVYQVAINSKPLGKISIH